MNENSSIIKSWQTHFFFHGNHRGNGLVCDMDCKFRKIYPPPSEVVAEAVAERIFQQKTLRLSAEIEKNTQIWFVMKTKN